ncbi:MAG: hypothetical protein NXI31_21720 [bacterium]|nr:hypothetical protein [bacterium]
MLRVAPALLLSTLLCSQESVELRRFVPATAQIVARIQAPACWAESFGRTKLADWFRGPTFAELTTSIREGFDRARDDDPVIQAMTIEVIEGLFADYRGEILVAMQVDTESPVGSPARFAAMITLVPGGDFALADLLAAFRRADELFADEVEAIPIEIGEHSFRMTADTLAATQLELVDDHLVMFVGTAIEEFGPEMLATSNRAEAVPQAAPLAIRASLDLFVDGFTRGLGLGLGAASAQESPIDPRDLADLLGASQLEAIELTISADDEAIVADLSLTTKSNAGLLGALLVEQGRPALLRHVPADVETFDVGSLDLPAVMRSFDGLLDLTDDGDAFHAAFTERTGVRLREDLFDHLGTEFMILGGITDLFRRLEEMRTLAVPDPSRLFADVCLGLSLRDGNAIARTIDTLLKSSHLDKARRNQEYGDHVIHLISVGGVLAFEYAVTEDLLLFVLGTRGNGSDYLRSVLDATVDPAGPGSQIEEQLQRLRPGWSGIGVTPMIQCLRTVTTAAIAHNRAGRRSVPTEEGFRIFQRILDDLENSGLDQLFCATYTSARQYRKVFRW